MAGSPSPSPKARGTQKPVANVESPKNRQLSLCGKVNLYAAFMLVGTACGWLLVNCAFQLPTNFTDVERMWSGPAAVINGATGLIVSVLFMAYNALCPKGLGRGAAQLGVACLCLVTVIGQVMLAGWWQVGRADMSFPIILIVLAMGNVVANATYFVAFPLITVHYGGWLIAPVRSGTDLSGLIATLTGEAQAPEGGAGPHTFPISNLYVGLAILAAAGLIAWTFIVCFRLGLREDDRMLTDDHVQVEIVQSDGQSEVQKDDVGRPSCSARLKGLLRGFSCPRSLAWPVVLATLSQVNYWTLGANLYFTASQMLNAPGDCDGHFGASALRIATTLNNALVPVGSVLSSIGRCPRPIFYCLFVVQSLCALALVLCTFGAGRESFWMTETGRGVFVAAYGLVGMLEGYLLTMAYRYCGDDDGVPAEKRESASKLLSLLGVVCVNVPNIFMGILLSNGSIECY